MNNLDIRKDNVRAIKNEIVNNFNTARSKLQIEPLF